MTGARDPDEDEDDEKKVVIFHLLRAHSNNRCGGKQNTDWPAQVVSKFVGVCGYALDLFDYVRYFVVCFCFSALKPATQGLLQVRDR